MTREEWLLAVQETLDKIYVALNDVDELLETIPDPAPAPDPDPTPIPTFGIDEGPTVTQAPEGYLTITWSLTAPGTGTTVYGLQPDLSDGKVIVNEIRPYETHVQRLRNTTFLPGTTYFFQVESSDGTNIVRSGIVAFTTAGTKPEPTPNPTPIPDPAQIAPDYLGCPFTAGSLGNMDVGDNAGDVLLPFISPYDASATSVTFYPVWAPGYGEGTGGTIEITICENLNGKPGAKIPGGMIVHRDLKTQYGGRGKWSMPGTFNSPVGPLKKGSAYFLRFHNSHPQQASNYLGVDILNHAGGYKFGSDVFPDSLLACTRQRPDGQIPTHGQRVNNCYDIGFDNGKHHSWPYMEVWLGTTTNSSGETNHWNAKVTATQWSRQRIVAPKDLTVTKVLIAGKREAGAGQLICELRDANNNILAKASVSSFLYADKQSFAAPVALSTPVSIKAGQTYFATLRAESGSTFRVHPLRCGAKSGGAYTKLVDGYCEWSTDTGRTWSGGWYGWNSSTRAKTADLPICFVP